MKKQLTILTIILLPTLAFGQAKQKLKQDTVKYTLNEPTIIQISNILSVANDIAAYSDKLSAHQYSEFVRQIKVVDSVLRVQYMLRHPQAKVETIKK